MFFVVRSNDSFNFPLGLIKYIVIVIALRLSGINSIFFFLKSEQVWPSGRALGW